jgi:hypothetical protein
MEWALLVFVIALVVVMTIVGKQQAAKTDAEWRRAAERLEGEFHPAVGRLIGAKSRRIVATVDRIEVEVDHYTQRSNDTTTTYTRLRARARAPEGFRLALSRTHLFSELARALGFQDVEVGNTSFDADHVVKASDPEAARLWLNGIVRKHILKAPEYRYQIEDGYVKAERSGLERSAPEIVRAVRAVAALADGRQRIFRVWGALAQQHGGKVRLRQRRWAQLEMERDGVPITIDTSVLHRRNYTVVRAQAVGAALEPFVLARDARLGCEEPPSDGLEELPDYQLWCDDRDGVVALLSASVQTAIAELRPAEVRVEADAVALWCRGISVDALELDGATALAAVLASGSTRGPYR